MYGLILLLVHSGFTARANTILRNSELGNGIFWSGVHLGPKLGTTAASTGKQYHFLRFNRRLGKHS